MAPRTTAGFRAAFLLAPALLLTGCDVEEVLEVELPGKVPEEALDNAALAETLAKSVISDVECAWDNYVAAASHHSDEYIQASGNLTMRNWGQRRLPANDPNYATGTCDGWGYGIYQTLQTARFQAEDVFQRLEGWTDEEVPDREGLKATVRAYGGYALTALGEGFCSMALDSGPELTPADVLRLAEERFTEAITLARSAGLEDIANMALVGRARVRIDLEDFDGAIADATQVPEGFRAVATRDQSDERRYNTHCEMVNCDNWRHASVAPSYRDVTWMGVPDPRVKVVDSGQLGFDFATQWFIHDKVTERSDPVPIASYKEAQLYVAEAAARTGDLARARSIINDRHERAGLPPFDPSGVASPEEVIAQVIEERRRELFVEGGHRLNDMLRFRGTQYEIPFLGEPGSDHPEGVDQTGVPYSDVTCFLLPETETAGNPNF